ncbi:MAG TPA: Spy/CpxP family protein refolding chaperone [Thermoanaerobaculia bacterium]|jgi:Spy/CpxP family protein refolding chaperone|nr:Spy/CpxP family protein refolding chaperone [Thermoanaerobaculia bacterium]
MKRIVIALSVALVATLALAQEPRRVFIHGGIEGEGIVSALNLSTDQKVQWDSIHQQLEASMQPLINQHRAAEQQLNTAANASNPDATTVGQAFLAMRAIDKQIKAAHESVKSQIDAILTPDQKAKFDAIHAKMEGEHGAMPMMRHLEGGPRD